MAPIPEDPNAYRADVAGKYISMVSGALGILNFALTFYKAWQARKGLDRKLATFLVVASAASILRILDVADELPETGGGSPIAVFMSLLAQFTISDHEKHAGSTSGAHHMAFRHSSEPRTDFLVADEAVDHKGTLATLDDVDSSNDGVCADD
ncbi:hypothetical protein PG984_007195 [Apiospora sp. TS-2023a]